MCDANVAQVNLTQVANTAYTLAQCIMLDSPGMSCGLATSLLNPDFQVCVELFIYIWLSHLR